MRRLLPDKEFVALMAFFVGWALLSPFIALWKALPDGAR